MSPQLIPYAKKITIIGNIASGKTKLSRYLSEKFSIPVTHIDSIQFDRDLNITSLEHTRHILNQVQQEDSWIIDGQGPLDMFQARFKKADLIIFIDLPIYMNFILLTYRLLKIFFIPRKELPAGSSELKWKHIKKQYRTTWIIYKKMRPELIKMLQQNEFQQKVLTITNLATY